MANLLKVAEMEKRGNINEKLALPVGCQLKEESNWTNNSKPTKPGKGPPAKKPSEKSGGSIKPAASKSSTKPGATASKSATKTPSKAGPAAPKPSKTAAASGAKTGEETLRGSKGEATPKDYSGAPSIPTSKQRSRTPSVERLVPDKKSPAQVPSEHNLPEPQESERPKNDEKVKEGKSKGAPRDKNAEEKQDEKDNERRATFCRKKERKSIVLSGCSPQATAYLQTVKKIFKEKDMHTEKSYLCTCAVNCKKMLIPKEVQPETKKSDEEDEFAKRLTGEICGEEKDEEDRDERPVEKTKSFNRSKSNQQITKI